MSDVLRAANARSDWRQARTTYEDYRQLVRCRSDRPLIVSAREHLAKAFSVIAPSYSQCLSEMATHAFGVFADVGEYDACDSEAFLALYRESGFPRLARSWPARRWASPLEAVVETTRRWRDADAVRAAFVGTPTSGIMCGSASYGAFFSTRGNRYGKSSDLDMVIALSNTPATSLSDRLSLVPGVRRRDIIDFDDRARIYEHKYDDGATILSHKFAMWTDEVDHSLLSHKLGTAYTLSLHVIPEAVLNLILVESSTNLVKESAGTRRVIRDYRGTSTRRRDELRSFAGHRHHLDPELRRVHKGFLRRTSVYYIDGHDCYCPGFLQTLIQHRRLCWDSAHVQARLDQLVGKLAERLRYERADRPYNDLRPSKAHVRLAEFAPSAIELLDQSYSPH